MIKRILSLIGGIVISIGFGYGVGYLLQYFFPAWTFWIGIVWGAAGVAVNIKDFLSGEEQEETIIEEEKPIRSYKSKCKKVPESEFDTYEEYEQFHQELERFQRDKEEGRLPELEERKSKFFPLLVVYIGGFLFFAIVLFKVLIATQAGFGLFWILGFIVVYAYLYKFLFYKDLMYEKNKLACEMGQKYVIGYEYKYRPMAIMTKIYILLFVLLVGLLGVALPMVANPY
jgi:hypothetical protein